MLVIRVGELIRLSGLISQTIALVYLLRMNFLPSFPQPTIEQFNLAEVLSNEL